MKLPGSFFLHFGGEPRGGTNHYFQTILSVHPPAQSKWHLYMHTEIEEQSVHDKEVITLLPTEKYVPFWYRTQIVVHDIEHVLDIGWRRNGWVCVFI